jgi:hypothetical protein
MHMKLRSVLAAAAAFLFLGAATPQIAVASVDSQFSAAVAKVLSGVRNEEEFLKSLSTSEFREFVKCAQRVMSAAPTKRKQYVLAASNTSELRQRFDEVALDNRAELKQQITRECAA